MLVTRERGGALVPSAGCVRSGLWGSSKVSRYVFELRSDGSVPRSGLERNGDGPLLTGTHLSQMIEELREAQHRLDTAEAAQAGTLGRRAVDVLGSGDPDRMGALRWGRVADPRRGRRCCGGRSIAHRPRRRSRCRYDVAELSAGFGARGFVIVMYRRRIRRRTSGPLTDVRRLCQHGRWVGGLEFDGSLTMGCGVKNGVAEQGNPAWVFRSEREADRMVQRLRSGLPVLRDRWLALGAVVLVAATVVQAGAAVVAAL